MINEVVGTCLKNPVNFLHVRKKAKVNAWWSGWIFSGQQI